MTWWSEEIVRRWWWDSEEMVRKREGRVIERSEAKKGTEANESNYYSSVKGWWCDGEEIVRRRLDRVGKTNGKWSKRRGEEASESSTSSSARMRSRGGMIVKSS
jgi:hypothetical protein